MKTNLPNLSLILIVGLLTIASGCKKGVKEPITLDKAAGKWSINAIRMKIYYGTTLSKDSTVPWRPVVENFVDFDGVSNLSYCFNSQYVIPGQYNFISQDSIQIQVGDETKRWKVQLLTSTNFNIESTSDNNPSFPGATVIIYKGFVR